jgi:ParB-like chromosome segregation protein Spo0J
MEINQVALDKLKTYRNNPRKGNTALIADSLATYGQYKPITVNKRTGEILAGNHTYQAAKSLGWKDIAVTYVDVDDDRAARIVAIDNRASDSGTYDNELLLELLETIGDLSNTGYTSDDIDDLLAEIQEAETPNISFAAVEAVREQQYTTHNAADGDNVNRIPTLAELAERYEGKSTRMVVLNYESAQYVWVIEKLTEYRKQADLLTNSDAIINLLEGHFKESAPGE